MIENMDYNKVPKEKSYNFYWVTIPGWRDGERTKIRLRHDRATSLSILKNTSVAWCLDQDKTDSGGVAGSQKALIYGSSRNASSPQQDMLQGFEE